LKGKKLSVKWKSFLYFVLFAGIVLVLLWLFQTVFLGDIYQMIKTQELKTSAEHLEKLLANGIDETKEAAESISTANEVCILILNPEGQTELSTNVLRDCMVHKMLPGELFRYYVLAKTTGGSYLETYERGIQPPPGMPEEAPFGMKPAQSLILVQVVTDQAGEEHILFLNSVISPVSATVRTLRVELIWITAIMLFLALIAALLLSRRIARPIESLNETAKTLAAGRYDVQFREDGYREIRELASTLNYAAVELSRVENLRRELMANISHDLRTPLTMITGYAEVMRDIPGENTPENVEVIIAEAKRLTSLVNDVLDYSRLQTDAVLKLTQFDLQEEIEKTVSQFSKLMPDCHTVYDPAVDPVWVRADVMRISQVLYNLIGNAVTYTGPDQTVTVILSVLPNYAEVSVADTGKGIDPDELACIWDRYYQGKNHKRAAVGSGIGLSIVKSVLEAHKKEQGEMVQYGVESTIGQGSRFWFRLERAE
jgi:signal transduction histidine kinase